MLTSSDQSTKSELFILREKLQASETEIDELRSILQSEQSRIK